MLQYAHISGQFKQPLIKGNSMNITAYISHTVGDKNNRTPVKKRSIDLFCCILSQLCHSKQREWHRWIENLFFYQAVSNWNWLFVLVHHCIMIKLGDPENCRDKNNRTDAEFLVFWNLSRQFVAQFCSWLRRINSRPLGIGFQCCTFFSSKWRLKKLS